MASLPAYDVNEFPGPKEAWMNRAIEAGYEPGSTFKIVAAAAARERNRVGFSELFDCSAGSIRVGGTTITDHEREQHPELPPGPHQVVQRRHGPLRPAAQHPGVLRDDQGLRLRDQDRHRPAGRGRRPRPSARGQWNKKNSLPHVAIGYEVRVTAIQTLTSMNVFATGGLRVRPHLVKGGGMPAEDGDGRRARHQREDRGRSRRARLQPRRRGGHGQGEPARRVRRRGEDGDGPEVG